jgi:hypothetical protein
MTAERKHVALYRVGETDELATLRAENARLRATIEELVEGLRPFSGPRSPCPFCGKTQYLDRVAKYVPGRPAGWLRRARAARLRRNCTECRAVWYERTKEAGGAE